MKALLPQVPLPAQPLVDKAAITSVSITKNGRGYVVVEAPPQSEHDWALNNKPQHPLRFVAPPALIIAYKTSDPDPEKMSAGVDYRAR